MRLHNLKSEHVNALQSQDYRLLKELLRSEYEAVKEELIDCPSEKLEMRRGAASTLRGILKVLG